MKRYNRAAIIKALMTVSKEVEVPVGWLMSFAHIESNYDNLAVNGRSRGLFQVQPAAWAHASEYVRLPSYNSNVWDPYWNATAAATYILINYWTLRKRGYNVDANPQWVYLAHQQGAFGAMELIDASRGVKSTSYVSTEKMWRNRAPGTTRTTNKVRFYRNWMAYLKSFHW